MYKQHATAIQDWAQDAPENMRDVMRFVILTIRYPIGLAAEDMREENTRALNGQRRYAWEMLGERYEEHYAELMRINAELTGDAREDALVAYVADLPGFGLAKAGFVAQLAFGCSGCLDSHNIERFGLNVWTFAHFKRKGPRARVRQLELYRRTVAECGGTEALWDTWCDYVGERDSRYPNGFHVSELHAWAFYLV